MGKTSKAALIFSFTEKHPHGRGEDPIIPDSAVPVEETPPRAWGRLMNDICASLSVGNTPTGVGKTFRTSKGADLPEKHPHGRGEDHKHCPNHVIEQETPPRAWGRRRINGGFQAGKGNTPTGVGKTIPTVPNLYLFQKHPHGRGEDPGNRIPSAHHLETPPRAWGRRVLLLLEPDLRGNTPTGVGKTSDLSQHRYHQRKHPHGRGEDHVFHDHSTKRRETPPRAWGRPLMALEEKKEIGNTPTGVGKTIREYQKAQTAKKHPHGRGEDSSGRYKNQQPLETPPRAWGRRPRQPLLVRTGRNTPTGVGKTVTAGKKSETPKKHPHGRGEDS